MVELIDTFAPTRQALSQVGQAFSPAARLQNIQLQQAKVGLAQLKKNREDEADLEKILAESEPGRESVTSLNFWKRRNPQRATEHAQRVMRQGESIMKIDKKGGVDFINKNLGTDFKYTGEEGKLIRIDSRNKTIFLDPISLKTVREVPIEAQPQSPKGKLQADVESGLITQEQADEAVKKNAADKKYSPTNLSKLIAERQAFKDQGLTEDHPIIKAFDSKITGTDINIEEMTPDQIDTWGAWVNLTGKVPPLGRGKQATAMRMKILKSAARQALKADIAGIPEGAPDQTPSEAALDMVATAADTKSIQGALNFLEKQLGSMGSFVTNLNSQVDRVGELSNDLKTFDTRLLNIPLRAVRGRIKGSPLQAKYDLFLSEIEAEIGKLATGSTGSVAELSASAQEKWAKIHDKNLSVKDMMELLEETKIAANFRIKSVSDELNKVRGKLRTRQYEVTGQPPADTLPEGARQIGTSGGKAVYQTPDGRQFVEE